MEEKIRKRKIVLVGTGFVGMSFAYSLLSEKGINELVLIDMNVTREVHAKDLHSRSDFSIFEGRRLTGWPVMTVKGGSIVMENGMLVADAPSGHMVKR